MELENAKMRLERELLELAASVLRSVERDTHYGLHDGDFCVPYGEPRRESTRTYDDCTCALCAIRKHLDENPTP